MAIDLQSKYIMLFVKYGVGTAYYIYPECIKLTQILTQ